MFYRLYRILTSAVSPFVPLYLARRAARGKEDKARMRERFGHAGLPRPEGEVLWVHAASVGEMNSAFSLIETLAEQSPGMHFLLTTVTVTSAKLAAKRMPPRTLHQFAPVDTPAAISRFLAHWRPERALFIDSELWPNMVVQARGAGVRLFIVNGRMSERSFAMWMRFPSFARFMLSQFRTVYAQSRMDAKRFGALGAKDVRCLGNLKYDATPLPCDEAALAALREQIGRRPAWLAASTHPGEEEQIVETHKSVGGMLTVIVPRHAVRGSGIAALIARSGFAVALRSRGDRITAATSFYIADTMGELGLFYRLCPLVFIGGSLVPHGGQNLIEPARLGCAIICGPHMENFAEVVEEFRKEGALLEVADAAGLALALGDTAQAEKAARAALTAANRYRGLTAHLAQALTADFQS